MRDGVCADSPDDWFPKRAADQRRAAATCRAECKVLANCLIRALENREWHGVWGGTTEHQRRMLLSNNPRVENWRERISADMRQQAAS